MASFLSSVPRSVLDLDGHYMVTCVKLHVLNFSGTCVKLQ